VWGRDASYAQITILSSTYTNSRLVAYNRVALTDYFQHRNVEKLYLNQGMLRVYIQIVFDPIPVTADWYTEQDPGRFQFFTGEAVTSIDTGAHTVTTDKGRTIRYNYCVFATGSDATLPDFASPPVNGVFVYRNISDLNKLLNYSQNESVKEQPVSPPVQTSLVNIC
jgi:nitrite reductase (NAD(P)H)